MIEIEFLPEGEHTIYADFTPSSEVEMCDFLYGLVRQLKPELIFEDGAGYGYGTLALARACRDNAKGSVIACETVTERQQIAAKRVKDLPANVLLQSTPVEPSVEKADFIYADGENCNRMECFRRAKSGCVVVVHDTNEPELRNFVLDHGGMVFPAGRGFGVLIK